MSINILVVKLTHTGHGPENVPCKTSIYLQDLEAGYEYQTRQTRPYVPYDANGVNNFIIIPITNRVTFSLEKGSIRKFVELGYLTAETLVSVDGVLNPFPGPSGGGDTGATGPAGQNGQEGVTGPAGGLGPTGPSGPPGIGAGDTGLTGPTGPTGLQGPTGSAGLYGETGYRGPTGFQGATGPQGLQGQTGPIGSSGSTGFQGSTGPQGPTGQTGPQGVTGLQGPTGLIGPDGNPGTPGADGNAGAPGADGNPGADGSTGPQGPTGIDGATGPDGATGLQGSVGDSGPTGPTGPTGLTGPNGSNGLARLGNVLVVDSINGNDSSGTVNGPSFLTVDGAITYINNNTLSGVTVWIMPGYYTLMNPLIVPNGCSIRGLSTQTTTIAYNANSPGNTVTLLTMGENTRVEDVSLRLFSTNDTTNLVGIHLPGTTSATSKLRTSVLTIDNSSVAATSSTEVYGVLSDGSGILSAATFSFNCLKGSTINVRSNGGGKKIGVYQPSGVGSANQLSTRDLNIFVAQPIYRESKGLYVGVMTDNDNSQIQIRSTSIGGAPFPSTNKKIPAALVTLTDIALSGLQTIDGYALISGDRILVAGQTSGVDNGLYAVSAGSWTRALDMQVGSLAYEAYVFITDGTYTHTGWECTTNANVGAQSLTFVQRYAGGDILQNAPQEGNGTNGIVIGPGTDLVTRTACSHPFTTYVTPTTLDYGLNGTLASGDRYLWPGVMPGSGDATQVFYRFQQKSILQGMFVNMRTPPGGTDSVTFTIYKSKTGEIGSGVPTGISMTVTGSGLSAHNYSQSLDFDRFDYLAIHALRTGSGSGDILLEVDLY